MLSTESCGESYEGHEVALKARTLLGDYLFAELGDEHEDLYVLADQKEKVPSLHLVHWVAEFLYSIHPVSYIKELEQKV